MITHRKNTIIRKRQIINATRGLITKYGSETVTVKRIAQKIGVSEGAIYRHFESKSEIFSFLLDDVERTLLQKGGQTKPSNAFELLEDMLLKQVACITKKQGMSFQIIAEIINLGDKKLSHRADEVISQYFEQIQKTLADGITSGHIRADLDIEAASILLFGIIQGLVTIWTISHYRTDLEQKCKYLWEIYRNSIKVSLL